MSLIDAVLPDIVATRHTLLHNRSIKPDISIKLEDGHYSHVNSMGHGEIMDIDGTVNDVGNNKVLLLKGHESEVDLTVRDDIIMWIEFEYKWLTVLCETKRNETKW